MLLSYHEVERYIAYPTKCDRLTGELWYTTFSSNNLQRDPVRHRTHDGKVMKVLAALEEFDKNWEVVSVFGSSSPANLFYELSNGEKSVLYVYRATEAPGSGQGYLFCPHTGIKLYDMKFQHWSSKLDLLSLMVNFGVTFTCDDDRAQYLIDYYRQLKNQKLDVETIITALKLCC